LISHHKLARNNSVRVAMQVVAWLLKQLCMWNTYLWWEFVVKRACPEGERGKTREGEEESRALQVQNGHKEKVVGNSISLFNSITWQVETSACIAGCLSCKHHSLDPWEQGRITLWLAGLCILHFHGLH
jgi:hypothetical protein